MRVLHVIDPVSPGGGACTLRLVADLVAAASECDHEVLLVGHGGHEALARSCGLHVRGVVPAPGRLPMLADRALSGVIRHMDRERRIDRFQAWTLSSLLLLCKVVDPARVTGYLPIGPTTDLSLMQLRLRDRLSPRSITAASAWIAAECAPLLGVDSGTIRIESPGVDPRAVFDDGSRRASIRHGLAVDDGTFLVGLFSEPGSWADAWPAANAAMRLQVMGRDVRVIVAPTVRRRPGTEAWLRDVGAGSAMIVDDAVMAPWTVLPALDAVLMPAGSAAPQPGIPGEPVSGSDVRGSAMRRVRASARWLVGSRGAARPCPGMLPLIWACAAAVPIVADDVPGVRAVIEEGVTGLLVPSGHYVRAADHLCRLVDDPVLRGRLGAAARSAAHRRFGMMRFVQAWRDDHAAPRPGYRGSASEAGHGVSGSSAGYQ